MPTRDKPVNKTITVRAGSWFSDGRNLKLKYAGNKKSKKNPQVETEPKLEKFGTGATFTGDAFPGGNIRENYSKQAVVTFSRMQPPTIGHEKLVNKIHAVADEYGATPMVFLSRKSGDKNNPIPYEKKFEYAKQAFGDVVKNHTFNNFFDVIEGMADAGFHHVHVVVGDDRLDLKRKLLDAYGSDYITVHSAGIRNPFSSDPIEAMSGTKMRDLAKNKNTNDFTKGLPMGLRDKGEEILRKSISESANSRYILKIQESLANKARQYGLPEYVLFEVFSRGCKNWVPNQKLTQEQYAYGRVNSFLGGGKAAQLDRDLLESINWIPFRAVKSSDAVRGGDLPDYQPKTMRDEVLPVKREKKSKKQAVAEQIIIPQNCQLIDITISESGIFSLFKNMDSGLYSLAKTHSNDGYCLMNENLTYPWTIIGDEEAIRGKFYNMQEELEGKVSVKPRRRYSLKPPKSKVKVKV